MREKISMISSRTKDSGWRVPRRIGSGVRVRSWRTLLIADCWLLICSLRSLMRVSACWRSVLSSCPSSRFSSAGTERNSLKRAVISPFLERYLIRRVSSSSALAADIDCTCVNNFWIVSFKAISRIVSEKSCKITTNFWYIKILVFFFAFRQGSKWKMQNRFSKMQKVTKKLAYLQFL